MRYRLTNAEGESVLHAESLHRIYRFLDHAPREPYTLTPQSLQVVPHGTYWQVIPPPPPNKDKSIFATLQRLVAAADQMAIEIEKLKSML